MRQQKWFGGKARVRHLAAALVMALCVFATGASTATAGPSRYVVEECDSALPGGGTPAAHFTVNPGVPLDPINECEKPGGAIGIAEHGHAEATFAFWTLPNPVPPGGKAEAVSIEASACNVGPNNIAFVGSNGWPVSACGVEQFSRFGLGGLPFSVPSWIFLGCDGNKGPCEAGAIVYARHFATTVVDPVAPQVSEGGELLAGEVRHGHQEIDVKAKDKGGGLSEITVLVNDLPAAPAAKPGCATYPTENESVSGPVTMVATPCPTSQEAKWTLDTQEYPFHNGTNKVEACASDFSILSEPNRTCSAPQAVEVDNTCTPSSVDGGESLSARFPASGSDSLTVPYDHSARVAGRLTDAGGDPIPGATLCVQMATAASGAQSSTVGDARTDASGHYQYEVAPGPNREVTVGYRHDSKQLTRHLGYFSHARPTLSLGPRRVRNGGAIRLWGKLPGPHAAGRVVVLQASAVGSSRWLTFRKATSHGDGLFRASYRFNGTHRRTAYRIRAVVPNQAGYPWKGGHSKPATVLVTG